MAKKYMNAKIFNEQFNLSFFSPKTRAVRASFDNMSYADKERSRKEKALDAKSDNVIVACMTFTRCLLLWRNFRPLLQKKTELF